MDFLKEPHAKRLHMGWIRGWARLGKGGFLVALPPAATYLRAIPPPWSFGLPDPFLNRHSGHLSQKRFLVWMVWVGVLSGCGRNATNAGAMRSNFCIGTFHREGVWGGKLL